MVVMRRKSRAVMVGKLCIGGEAPVSVQTMAKFPSDDVEALVAEVKAAADLGCNLIRLAIPNAEAVGFFGEVKRRSPLPLVADIHFDCALAIGAIKAGADKIRINPGNMKDWEGVAAVVAEAKRTGCAIRIGVNSGSIFGKEKLPEGDPAARQKQIAEKLASEALGYCERIEGMGFRDLVISLKATDAPTTIAANMAIASRCDYPLHLGVTEAGPEDEALLKSAVGIGGLLAQGIGDTIRVSYTGPSAPEVLAGQAILRAAGLLHDRVEIVSCPTCGRCKSNTKDVLSKVRQRIAHIKTPLVVAVMGCEVNGPGEAAQADIGIAAGKGRYALFASGKMLGSVPEEEVVDRFCAEIERLAAEREVKK